ncbi:FIST signal transduction protein [Aeromonas bivalvium]|uniref:FIST signal transduction protein n=1 Tax=Aeromonas bivalvium TaxID=440079 RepID=UPI0038D2443D
MAVNFLTAHSLAASSALACREVCDRLEELAPAAAPSLLIVYFTQAHDAGVLRQALTGRYPHVRLIGCSSCHGVQTQSGYHSAHGWGLAVAALFDEKGCYGVAGGLGEAVDMRALLHGAMAEAGRPGELPAMVLLHASPGREEGLLAAIEDEFGCRVPVVGGSAADDAIRGDWQLCWQGGEGREGVVLALLYPDCELAFQFHSGYLATAHHGLVTACDGREVLTIDGEPAAWVYASWRGLAPFPVGPILAQSTLAPLARQRGTLDGVPYYKLSHPEAVTARGGLRLFTTIEPGERLILMHGSAEGLLARSLAAHIEPGYGGCGAVRPLGALLIFCAGSRLALGERIQGFGNLLEAQLGAIPFITPFTFGEQGRLPHGELAHGNLMVSAVVLLGGVDAS